MMTPQSPCSGRETAAKVNNLRGHQDALDCAAEGENNNLKTSQQRCSKDASDTPCLSPQQYRSSSSELQSTERTQVRVKHAPEAVAATTINTNSGTVTLLGEPQANETSYFKEKYTFGQNYSHNFASDSPVFECCLPRMHQQTFRPDPKCRECMRLLQMIPVHYERFLEHVDCFHT
ncbi:hypothetical protein FH972_023918 [Carpinus fangiana]|uniref:Uncharacterized protein n=1 Tax=Carpinus fangiana TaxID=176857 RepID=A0A5N6KWJ6_9ROSI|nr:hypothetical protein FH972_023918 [Carpinus fangiana]